PRILDGDHGLRSEVLDQLDLLIGEWLNLLTINAESSNQLFFFEHRDDKHRSHASLLDRRDGEGIAVQIALIFREVCHMHGLPRPLGPTERRQWPGLKGLVLHLLDKIGLSTSQGLDPESIAVRAEYEA